MLFLMTMVALLVGGLLAVLSRNDTWRWIRVRKVRVPVPKEEGRAVHRIAVHSSWRRGCLHRRRLSPGPGPRPTTLRRLLTRLSRKNAISRLRLNVREALSRKRRRSPRETQSEIDV